MRGAWRLLSWVLPIAAVLCFIVLHVVAAWLYPGGTRADPDRRGFSFVQNYWCDLLDTTTYGGRRNPARSVALAATAILCCGLAVLLLAAPALFPLAPRRGWIVRLGGVGCAMVVPWVASRFHDLAINLAGIFGVVSLVATITAVRRDVGGEPLRTIGWCVLALVILNYFVWETGLGLWLLPLVQRLAFAALLVWVVLLALRLR